MAGVVPKRGELLDTLMDCRVRINAALEATDYAIRCAEEAEIVVKAATEMLTHHRMTRDTARRIERRETVSAD
jgi:hypothetical protein